MTAKGWARLLVALLAICAIGCQKAASDALPALGTQLSPLPEGGGKSIADRACVPCHSADILRQQRLTETQWSASVTKMIGWGAFVADEEKALLISYLASNFGPENDRFRPVVTRPVGR